ncbi:transcription-repair coupling factor, partial [Flavobacteriaceae bacterium]|nr:transcription-repair coupling factor [Flavobacteriaceae bacterium]
MILDNAEQAAYYLNDLERLLKPSDVLYFPASYRQAYAQETTDNANVLLRSEVLKKISGSKKPRIIISYPQAVFEKIISQNTLKRITFKIIKDTILSLNFINESLFEMGFQRVDFVTSPGEFAVRGGIIDVFSFAYQHPYRIEFFDDTVERLCSFDVQTQRSITAFDSIELLPDTSNNDFTDKRKSILEFFPANSSFIFSNFDKTTARLEQLFEKATDAYNSKEVTTQYPPETLFMNRDEWIKDSHNKSVFVLERTEDLPITSQIHVKQSPQPAFNKQFDILISHLNENNKRGYKNTLFCSNEQQTKRFHDIFQELEKTVHYKTEVLSIYEGFEDLEAQWACFSDHQIFERYHKYQLKSDAARKQALNLKELTQMEVGDYVTHIDHGIGTFGGLQRIEVEGKWQEAIKLIYGERDILYLSIHSLHKISKY